MDSSNAAKSGLSPQLGYLDGAIPDEQSITSDWTMIQSPITGVKTQEVKNVIKGGGGILTEVFRRDWNLDDGVVDQVFQNVLNPAEISGWHVHMKTVDRLFVNLGTMKVVLYDARSESSTYGLINEFTTGDCRPSLTVIPPGVWHAVQNIGPTRSALLNLVDHAYDYGQPDHIRLPIGTDQIPYEFR